MLNKTFAWLFIALGCTLFVASNSSYSGEVIDKVVAVVNDEIITLSELENRAVFVNENSEEPMDKKAVLDQMIEQKLLEQEAEKQGISVTDQEVDVAIQAAKQKFDLTDEQMEEVLAKQNLTPEAFRKQWKMQLLADKLISTRIKGQIAVTEDEIEKEYEKTAPEPGTKGGVEEGKEVRISHILISSHSPDAEKKANEVAEMAKSGEDFGELAKQYSDDDISAERGGDLGYFQQGELVKPLEEAVISTPVGEITGPVKSPVGYHIVKVVDSKEPGESTLDGSVQDREQIKQRIYQEKAQEALKEWIKEIRETAYVEKKI